MRSRRTAQEELTAIARRRLELLSAEMEGIRSSTSSSTHDASDAAAMNELVDESGRTVGPEQRVDTKTVSEAKASRHTERPTGVEDPIRLEDPANAEGETASGAPPVDLVGLIAALGGVERSSVEGLRSGAPSRPGSGADRFEDVGPERGGSFLERALEQPPVELPRGSGRHARRPVAAPDRFGGWVHDRLPPTLQGRVALTAGHLSVVALLVAAAFATTAWWVVRADGGATVVPAASWTDATASATATPSALITPAADVPVAEPEAEPAVVVVDVAGKVRRPGIATLPLGSRVVDALEAAGGVRRGVDLTSLNLARLLVDGEQILVGISPPGGVAAPAASGAGGSAGPMVNLNTATAAQLEELPGVGPVTAASILQWRTDNGPFTAVDELLEVSGIGDATLAEIAPFVTL